MNWLDMVIIVAVALPAFIGFRTGVLRTVFTVGGVIVGLLLARMYTSDVAAVLANFVDNETFQNVSGFALVLLAAVVAATVAARLVKGVLQLFLLGWVDNGLGAALGIVVGASVAAGVLLVMETTASATVQQSTLAPIFRDLWGPVVEVVLGNARALVDVPGVPGLDN